MATTRKKMVAGRGAAGRAVVRHPDFEPSHPGELLRDIVLPGLEMSVTEAAQRLGVSRMQLHRILAGTAAVTPDMALRLGKFCGNGPDLWLAMQQDHDLWHGERRLRRELARIETAKAA